MKSSESLRDILYDIDHSGYPAYKRTKGSFKFPGFVLTIGKVQSDPYAPPSKLAVEISSDTAGIPAGYYGSPHRKRALEDALLRNFSRGLAAIRKGSGEGAPQGREDSRGRGREGHAGHGSGKSGQVFTTRPGQEILTRSAVSVSDRGDVTLRFEAGFPARGRTIQVRELVEILFDRIPGIIANAVYYERLDKRKLKEAIELADDQRYIREKLGELGLAAFVADGSILPRESGVSQKPMKNAVPFKSPQEMAVELDLPHAGRKRGMGVSRGITLIVGGGYHGKSTLLVALETGVYDHIAGDGREYCITDDTAVKLRAEDGRSIRNTDISMFIDLLPNGKDTVHFETEDASGSTSQAANVIEAVEAGAGVLLIDEDTSATNFMVRDDLMQQVVSPEQEPITPFISRIRELYETRGISTILVAGSSGSYFNVADSVIQMNSYIPSEITGNAKQRAKEYGHAPLPARTPMVIPDFDRRPLRDGSLSKDRRGPKTKTMGKDGFSINRETVELRGLEQITDSEITSALSYALKILAMEVFDGRKTLTEAVDELERDLEREGIDFLFGDSFPTPGLALPRRQEIFGCVNRYRRLHMK